MDMRVISSFPMVWNCSVDADMIYFKSNGRVGILNPSVVWELNPSVVWELNTSVIGGRFEKRPYMR